MKLLCIGGAVLVGICLIGKDLVKIAFPDDIGTYIPQDTSKGYYEIHIDGKAQGNKNNNSSASDKAAENTSSWNLLLVNPWNYIPRGFFGGIEADEKRTFY